MQVGYHSSHELYPPSELLEHVKLASQAGFRAAMCSDHIAPFSERQGHSGFAWSWAGAALEATALSFGLVCAPGYRYHPAVVAQGAATLAEMFPGRFWLALGSGEYINEHITGESWPEKRLRMRRLEESAEVIRRLIRGEEVTHRGLVAVEQARLYVRPSTPPPLIAAAISEETAEWAGSWADGLITVARPHDDLARVVEAFRRGGGAGKPMYLQAQVSFAPTREQAVAEAFERWPNAGLPPDLLAELKLPSLIDAALSNTRPEDVARVMRISERIDDHLEWITGDAALGFEVEYVHNVAREQAPFIEAYARSILPRFAPIHAEGVRA
jgi:probable non-F420 flavinoid oxidoreductase